KRRRRHCAFGPRRHRIHPRTSAAPRDPTPLVVAQRIRITHGVGTATRTRHLQRRRERVLADLDQRQAARQDYNRERSAMKPFLVATRDDAVLTVRMDRPESRNALTDPQQMQEFVDLCAEVRRDISVKVMVLTGNGAAFCAGGNVKDMKARGGIFAGSPYEIRNSYRDTIQRIPLALYELEIPVIAAVNGPAIGAGLDLACMCD